MILYIRTHPLRYVELRQEWQAQINPPVGRQDLTTDCASEPPGWKALGDRGNILLFMSPRRPQLQGNLA